MYVVFEHAYTLDILYTYLFICSFFRMRTYTRNTYILHIYIPIFHLNFFPLLLVNCVKSTITPVAFYKNDNIHLSSVLLQKDLLKNRDLLVHFIFYLYFIYFSTLLIDLLHVTGSSLYVSKSVNNFLKYTFLIGRRFKLFSQTSKYVWLILKVCYILKVLFDSTLVTLKIRIV